MIHHSVILSFSIKQINYILFPLPLSIFYFLAAFLAAGFLAGFSSTAGVATGVGTVAKPPSLTSGTIELPVTADLI